MLALAVLTFALVPHGLRLCAPPTSTGHPAVMLAKKMAPAKKNGAARPAAMSSKGFGAVASSRPPAAAARPAEWSALEEWLSASGASHDAVELYVDEDGLRGIQTLHGVKRGKELLRIPRAIILDEAVADASPVGRLWTEPTAGAPATPLPPPYARMALLVLYEMRRGDESPYASHMRLLPSPSDFAAEGGPTVLWEEEELALLECAKLLSDTHARRARVEQSSVLGTDALAARWALLGLPGAAPSVAELRWAVAAVTSRAYGAQQKDGTAASLLIPMVRPQPTDNTTLSHTDNPRPPRSTSSTTIPAGNLAHNQTWSLRPASSYTATPTPSRTAHFWAKTPRTATAQLTAPVAHGPLLWPLPFRTRHKAQGNLA